MKRGRSSTLTTTLNHLHEDELKINGDNVQLDATDREKGPTVEGPTEDLHGQHALGRNPGTSSASAGTQPTSGGRALSDKKRKKRVQFQPLEQDRGATERKCQRVRRPPSLSTYDGRYPAFLISGEKKKKGKDGRSRAPVGKEKIRRAGKQFL